MFKVMKSFVIGLIAVMVLSAAGDASAVGRHGLRLSLYDNHDAGWDGEDWESIQPWSDGPVGSRCAYNIVQNIDFNFTSGIGSCPTDEEDDGGVYDLLSNFTGYMRVPRTGVYTLYARVDDGFYLKVGRDVVLQDWEDQGPDDYNVQGTVTLRRGRPYKVDAWYYENGGGNDVHLYYSMNGSEPVIVPSRWFSLRP